MLAVPPPLMAVGFLCLVQPKNKKGRFQNLLNPDPNNACAVSQVMVAEDGRVKLRCSHAQSLEFCQVASQAEGAPSSRPSGTRMSWSTKRHAILRGQAFALQIILLGAVWALCTSLA